jgi:hypothetical protein
VTRAFEIGFGDGDEGGSGECVGHVVMAPCIDMVNHAADSRDVNAHFRSSVSHADDGDAEGVGAQRHAAEALRLQMVASRDIEAGEQVSQKGYRLSRRGRSLPASAGGFDTHRDSMTSCFRHRCGGAGADRLRPPLLRAESVAALRSGATGDRLLLLRRRRRSQALRRG